MAARWAMLVMVLVAALTLGACGGREGLVAGTVTEAATGEPLAGATVAVYVIQRPAGAESLDVFTQGNLIHKVLTAADGAYSVALEPGRYVVEVWVEGYTVDKRLIELRAGRTLPLDFAVTSPAP